MVDKICDKLMDKVHAKMPEVDEERAEVIRYGFELIIGEVPKIILMFLIAAAICKLKYFIISVMIICPYRTFSGGVHLKSHIGCFIATSSMYLGNVFLSEWIIIPNNYIKYIILILVYIFSIIMIHIYVPADTETVPILRKKDRKNKKIISFVILSTIIIVSVVSKDRVISNMCIVGVVLQTITVTGVIYKIFKVKYGYFETIKSL